MILTQAPAVVCPVSHEASPADGKKVDYNGVRYTMCCGDCDKMFTKEPAKALSDKGLEGKLVGVALFDPVSGARIEQKAAKASSDYKGIRYFFLTSDEKTTFDGAPDTYATAPKKEALWCAVMGHAVDDYATAGGYVDLDGTRYYVCCTDCLAKMKVQAKALAPSAKDHVHEPVAVIEKVAPAGN